MVTADELLPDAGEVVADVLRAAYYYATVDGHPVVGTDLVLTAAARNNDIAGSLLGAAVVDARDRLRPANGPVEPPATAIVPVACPHAGTLREARWWVLRDSKEADRRRFSLLDAGHGGPVWTPDVCAALVRAGREAAAAGVDCVGVEHLLLGLLDEDHGPVRSLAAATGLDVAVTVRRIRARAPRGAPQPYEPPLMELLQMFGGIDQQEHWLVRWIPRWMASAAVRDARLSGPVLACLEEEALRQAVLVGHHSVQTGALLLATLSLEEQLTASGQRLRAAFAPHNQGGRLLADLGIDLRRAQGVVESITDDGTRLPAEEAASRFWGSGKPGDPDWNEHAVRAMDRASGLARDRGHTDIGTSHLLTALLEDGGSAAARVLAKLGVDPSQVRTRVVNQLAGG